MTINNKIAIPLKLHCPLRETGCPGFIEKDVLMYLVEPDELYVYGLCGECGSGGNITLSLMKLLAQCPVGQVM
jgi:hypothetical protein